jgi:hypothetical protein
LLVVERENGTVVVGLGLNDVFPRLKKRISGDFPQRSLEKRPVAPVFVMAK